MISIISYRKVEKNVQSEIDADASISLEERYVDKSTLNLNQLDSRSSLKGEVILAASSS